MPSVLPRIAAALESTLAFLTDPEFEALLDDPEINNFALGNPQELPLPELIGATGAPADTLCRACFDGEYPVPVNVDRDTPSKFALEAGITTT